MKIWIRTSIILTLIIIFTGSGFGSKNKVLIIGIDGCRPDCLLSAKTPNIDKLWLDGAFSFHTATDKITLSGPCWTSMLSGVWSSKHGILDNDYKTRSKYSHFFTRIKKNKPEIKTASIVQWAPIHKILPSNSVDVKRSAKPDSAVTGLVLKTLSDDDLDILFVQFDDVDHTGHKYGYGPHISEYLRSIETTDKLVGMIIGTLKNRKSYKKENWLIILSTDHGGIDKGHGGNTLQENTTFCIISGNSIQKGEIVKPVSTVDIAVTAMSHLGIIIVPDWDLDGKIQCIKTKPE